MGNSIYDSGVIYKYLSFLKFEGHFRRLVLRHIVSILLSVFMAGYKGKTVQMSENSEKCRTTVAHFLNHGQWDDDLLEQILRREVIRRIYDESERTGEPVFCIADDTISSKTKLSSQAKHPIQDAYFHQSHLKKKQDYGHQAVGVMLSCNGLVLNYAIVMYDKSQSKIQIVCDIAEELPIAPVPSFFLCDCWYSCTKVMDAFLLKGFYTIGALKTNRIIFPADVRQNISRFARFILKTDPNVNLVTVGKRQYYVYRYEGRLNDLENAVVLISYPKGAFGIPGALRSFICTDCSLSTSQILNNYLQRWTIEVFFRQAKQSLVLDKYQIRSSKGIRRFWLLMSVAHYICCMASGKECSFERGYEVIQKQLLTERITYIYNCGAARVSLDSVLALVA